MEYIGATGKPISFNDIPIREGIDFHFILGFAIDSDAKGTSQNGKFSTYWASTITRDSISTLKSQHPNVKVLASLSGWSMGTKVLHWYAPQNQELWISNAVSSLQTIIQTYHLDGLDIDYEKFDNSNQTFAYCIGEVISRLKNQNAISVATIAPFYNTTLPYIDLYKRYGNVIDYVNHQFYTDKVKTPNTYFQDFELRAKQFQVEKVLPSYEVNGRGIQGDAFFEAMRLIQRNGYNISGVMIFSADASMSNQYYYEQKIQDFLLNSTSTP
ncbi:hypothetical protein Leryth_001999 [Lithospermum erythrorhizon]|uniref:GH18 domain-containing protein n=1 Tax=Lithospermum erythrorhizon TaxID=34254 RepID=A0AAV3P969_LITER|nr:hypothetical protein Leryth_001999 [Lithospermum erythrorhizon]